MIGRIKTLGDKVCELLGLGILRIRVQKRLHYKVIFLPPEGSLEFIHLTMESGPFQEDEIASTKEEGNDLIF